MVTAELLPTRKTKATNPFPGLRPFNSDEQNIFFGRDGLSDTLVDKLHSNRFVAVVGTSGSGKSSLVRAGLLPSLRSGFTEAGSGWHVAMFRPINNPIHYLATALAQTGLFSHKSDNKAQTITRIEKALRRSSFGLLELVRDAQLPRYENLLIVADQFEELYRFEPGPEVESPKDEASAFVRLLLEATNQSELPIYVILTMRSDYLGDSAQFWGLPEAINRGQFLIPRMDDDEKREAIEGPIRVFDKSVSPALVNRLVNDVGDDPRQLPILQHALMRTWDYWKTNKVDSEPIGIEHYDNVKVGGMKAALSIHADEAYNDLTAEQQELAEKIFKRLTEKGVGKREGRLPATVSELIEITGANEAEVIKVIDAFRQEGRSFLMPPPAKSPADPTQTGKRLDRKTLIDISHESLISGWTMLNSWVEEEAISAKIYQRLVDFALMYPNDFMTHPQLGVTLKWRDDNKPNQVWAKRYRTDFGKALAECRERTRAGLIAEKPQGMPEWATECETEFDIAKTYLERSEKKSLQARQRRRFRRRFAFTAVAALAVLFLIGGTAASAFLNNRKDAALAAQKKAVEDRELANQMREKADGLTKEAEEQRQKFYDLYDEYFAAYKAAEQEHQNAVRNAQIANSLRIQAENNSVRSSELEFILSFLSPTEDKPNVDQAIGAYSRLQKIYLRTGEFNKLGGTALQIGSLIMNSSDIAGDKALPFYAEVLQVSKQRPDKIDPSILARMGDSIIESFDVDNEEAIPYYRRAVEVSATSQNVNLHIRALTKLGQLYLDNDQDSLGETQLGKAYELALDESGSNSLEALCDIADVYMNRNANTALSLYNLADEVYSAEASHSFKSLSGAARAAQGKGDVYRTLKERKLANENFRKALQRYQQALAIKDGVTQKQRADAQRMARTVSQAIQATSTTPIENILSRAIDESGIEVAVRQYHDLKQNKPKDYDFSEEGVNAFGYSLLGNKKLKEAIEVFKLNLETYPDSYNTWDSLGEAYMLAGDKDNAIKNYERSVQINPANWRGVDALKKLKGQGR